VKKDEITLEARKICIFLPFVPLDKVCSESNQVISISRFLFVVI